MKAVWGLILSLFLATSLFVAGCGGGSGDEALTKAEFTKKADAICEQENDLITTEAHTFEEKTTIGPAGDEPSKLEATQIGKGIVISHLQTEISRLESLEPPDADADEVQAFVDAVKAEIADAKKDPASLVLGDTPPFAKSNELAKDYGLKECAKT